MAELLNPHTGKTVEADGEVAETLLAVGFTQVEVKRKPGRPKKGA